MAQTSDDERLLSILEPPAGESIPAGYKIGRLADMAISGPEPEFRMVKGSRGKLVSAPTADSLRLARAVATIPWLVLDPRSPEAERIWCQNVQAAEDKMREQSAATAKPVENKGVKPILRIIRV